MRGFTTVELLVVALITSILATFILISINSEDTKRKGRDLRRMTDLQSLSQSIETFYIDKNNTLPDLSAKDSARVSNTLPSGSSGPLQSSSSAGWIQENLTNYIEKLPVDPTNSEDYVYRYRVDCSGLRYKLDAKLEFYKDLMLNTKDEGSDDNFYEIGNFSSTYPVDMGAGAC